MMVLCSSERRSNMRTLPSAPQEIVHVVSMEEVMIKDGETVFQSNEVIGAVCSGDFELESSARGDNFKREEERSFDWGRDMKLE